MSAVEYVAAAALAWLVGFLPPFEIYVAIPVGSALGYLLGAYWPAFGRALVGRERLAQRVFPGQIHPCASSRGASGAPSPSIQPVTDRATDETHQNAHDRTGTPYPADLHKV